MICPVAAKVAGLGAQTSRSVGLLRIDAAGVKMNRWPDSSCLDFPALSTYRSESSSPEEPERGVLTFPGSLGRAARPRSLLNQPESPARGSMLALRAG